MYKVHLRRILFFGLLGILAGVGFFLFAPKVYEGRAQLLVANDARRMDPNMPEEVTAILSMGLTQSVETEVAILGGENVFAQALILYAEKTGRAELDPRRMTLEQFLTHYRMTNVFNPEKTRVCDVRVRAYDPQQAADLTNQIVEVYNDARLRAARTSVVQASEYLTRQIDSSKKELEQLDERLRTYKKERGIADLPTTARDYEMYQAKLVEELGTLRSNLADIDKSMAKTKAEMAKLKPRSLDVEGDQTFVSKQAIEGQLTTARASLASLKERFLDDHPAILATKAEIAVYETRLADINSGKADVVSRVTRPDPLYSQLEASLTGSLVRRVGLQAAYRVANDKLAEQEAKIAQLPDDEKTLVQLDRDRLITDMKYKQLKSMIEDLNNRTNAGVRAAQVLFDATVPEEPVAPDFWISVLVATLGGLTIGLLYSFGFEALSPRIYDTNQLAEVTGLPVLPGGTVAPALTAVKSLRAASNVLGLRMERFRFLAIQIAKHPEAASKAVLFSGVGPRAGVSYSAIQVGRALAASGSKTLLVDGDIRRKTLTRAFGLEEKPGLVDVLAKGALPESTSAAELFQATGQDGLDVLPSGKAEGIALTNYSREEIAAALKLMTGTYEHVIIDAPPCDLAADASYVASLVDEVVLFANSKKADQAKVLRTCAALETAGVKAVRVSLTHVKEASASAAA